MVRKWLLAGASFGFIGAPAFAQEAPPAEDNGGLEEIIVTAQKREENLQNVPVAVTALSSEAIANARIADFSDLTRAAPSLTITQTTSAPNNAIVLRGIGTFAFSIGVEPSVAVIIDDMPVVQQAQAFDNMADLERIEVLKGPQGRLFGKSASAGVVNIVTKDPGNEFGSFVSATGATDGDYRLEAAVSAPLGDGTGLRLTGFYHNFRGNVRNLTTGTRLNDQENFGFCAKLKSELSSNLTFTLTAAYGKSTQDGTATTLRGIFGPGTAAIGGVALVPSLVGITPGTGNYNARVNSLGATRNVTKSVAGKFNLDLGFANLISVTAYQDWKFNFQNDFDNSDIATISQQGPYHSTNFTQELRLVSSGKDALKYVVGGFYSKADTERAFTRGPAAAASWQAKNGNWSLGLFAQVDYTLPSETTISGGLRYNNEKISVAFDNLLATATANTCILNTALCRGSNKDSVVTWKGAISQKVAQNAMVFASVAKGYKGFAYDIVTGFNPARINPALNGTGAGLSGVGPVKPENSTSFEVGLKSRFADNRIQLNIIGFYTNYKNFQAQTAVLVGGVPQFLLNNVGKLRTKGVELEFQAEANDWLRIDAGATFTDAVMTSFPAAQGYESQPGTHPDCVDVFPAGGANAGLCRTQNRSGYRPPNAPKLKWNLGATADFPLSDSIDGTFMLNYQHQSAVNFDLKGNPLLNQAGYGIMNASFGVEVSNFKITAFVNNLFNKHYAATLADNFGIVGGNAANNIHPIYQFLPRDSERYFGLKIGYNF